MDQKTPDLKETEFEIPATQETFEAQVLIKTKPYKVRYYPGTRLMPSYSLEQPRRVIASGKFRVELVPSSVKDGKPVLIIEEEAVLGKAEDKHSKPPVGSWDDWDKWVKDVYALLLEYVETFPREVELRDRAYPLLNRVYEDFINKETAKKQEESTALFDVIGRAVLQHSGKRFEAQSSDDTVLATYNVIYNDWSLVSADGKPVEIDRTKEKLQTLADKHKIDLSKGWRLINVSGTRG